MPRPIWKEAISFGLVTIPVGLYSATEEKRPAFNRLRKSDGCRIRYRKVVETDGTEVASSEIVKGNEIDKGRYVVFSDDELTMAGRIIDNLTVPFDPIEWIDESRATVEELARRMMEDEETISTEAAQPAGVVGPDGSAQGERRGHQGQTQGGLTGVGQAGSTTRLPAPP